MMGPKSTNMEKVQYPSSMDTLYGLLEVLKNPALFTKQLDALKAYMDKANQTIETLGKAEKIQNLLDDAKVKQTKADEILINARQESSQLIDKAKKQSEEMIQKAINQVSEIIKSADSKLEAAKLNEVAAKNERNQSTEMLQQVKSQKNILDRREQDLVKRESEVSRKEKILKQLT
jgi:hypothetical protein